MERITIGMMPYLTGLRSGEGYLPVVVPLSIAELPGIGHIALAEHDIDGGIEYGIDRYGQMEHTIASGCGTGLETGRIDGIEGIVVLDGEDDILDELPVIGTTPGIAGLRLAEGQAIERLVVRETLEDDELIDRITLRQHYGLETVEDLSDRRRRQTDIVRIGALPFITHDNRVAPVNRIIVAQITILTNQVCILDGQLQAIDTVTLRIGIDLHLVIVVEIERRLLGDIGERTIYLSVPIISLVIAHRILIDMQEGLVVDEGQMVDRVTAEAGMT